MFFLSENSPKTLKKNEGILEKTEIRPKVEHKESNIIVIGRQYGGSGRKIGKALSSLLDMDYYDKEIINKMSAQYGYDPDILTHADEKKPSAFRSMLLGKYGVMDMYSTSPMSRESLYAAQADVIRQIGQEGNCVIVGRTADYVLRNHSGLISVFVHAPQEWRARNVMQRGEAATIQEALAMIKKADADREGYYNYFTGRNWGHAANYHLTLDASMIDTQSAAEMIAAFVEKRIKGKG